MSLWKNDILVNAMIAWIIAQVLKVIIYALMNRKLDIRRLCGDGGMPSGHSATVTAMAVTAGMECGLDSAAFAVAAILAIIVMHDAMGVRLEAGKHAKALNELLELFSSDLESDIKMKEFLGHTPLQVAFGALLGLVIALILG